MQKLRLKGTKGLLIAGVAVCLIAWLLLGRDESSVNAPAPDEPTPQVSEDSLNVSAEGNEADATLEQDLQETAAVLAEQPHYEPNEEQGERKGIYKRTSYYDAPIGYIESKRVGISETIYSGASELNMRRGVATVEYQEQLDEHTVAIAGHRSPNRKQFLTGALYLQPGDEVTVHRYKEGTTEIISSTTYVVDNTIAVTPVDVQVLNEDQSKGKRKLILITCYKYNPETGLYDERFIVNAYEK